MATNESNYKTSATEFGKRLTALYRLKIFPRLGNEFADKLYKSGIEAGANILALGNLSDADSKLKVGRDAIVKLNEVAFALQVMVEGGFYTADETVPVSNYIEKLIEALSKLIASIKERQAASEKMHNAQASRRVVIEQKPVVKSKVVIRSSEEILKEAEEEYEAAHGETAAAQDSKTENNSENGEAKSAGDGFGEPYKANKSKTNKTTKK